MKSILSIGLLNICLLLLLISCTESAPAPTCLQAEVVGSDCESGWYVLSIENEVGNKSNSYVGQLQSGYVTTKTLPDEYKVSGMKLNVALEILGDDSPRCVNVYQAYPAVYVKQVCDSSPPVID